MILACLLVLTLLSGSIALGECYYERDWPRDTGFYFVAFAAATILWML